MQSTPLTFAPLVPFINVLCDKALSAFGDRGVLALASGEDSVRFRMPLVITAEEVDGALERITDALPLAAEA